LKSKPGTAMVQMGDAVAVERAISNLTGTTFFDEKLSLAWVISASCTRRVKCYPEFRRFIYAPKWTGLIFLIWAGILSCFRVIHVFPNVCTVNTSIILPSQLAYCEVVIKENAVLKYLQLIHAESYQQIEAIKKHSAHCTICSYNVYKRSLFYFTSQ